MVFSRAQTLASYIHAVIILIYVPPTESTCSMSKSQIARDLSRQRRWSAWEKIHPCRLMSQPLQLTSCFLPGRGHHTVCHRSHGTFHATECPRKLQSDWLYCLSFLYQAASRRTFRFLHYHDSSFVATSQHMKTTSSLAAWFLFNGPQGLLPGPQLPTGPNTFYTG